MGILDSVSRKNRVYWLGLFVTGISAIVLFGTIWYAVFPLYLDIPKSSTKEAVIQKNLTNGVPVMVGSAVFIAIGMHMVMSTRKGNH